MNATRAIALCSAVGAMTMAGCGSFLAPRPDPSRFYVLTATATGAGSAVPGSFGVGPVTMPAYLKRASVVTRTSPNEIIPSSIDRWGESLDTAVPRVVQENLRRLLGSDRVVLFPWYATERPEVQVLIDVLRFDRNPDGSVTLHARWEVRRGDTSALLRSGDTNATREPIGPGMDGSVAAQSALLTQLSDDIATAIRATRSRA
jgi:uncharacterized lipoprotein YmbA